MLDLERPWLPASEAYRVLRTNIQFAAPETPLRVFLFTSPGPSEGKSLTVANLAIAMAQMGRQILVVDADLRRPVQHMHFGLPGELGMTDVLARRLAWREAILPTTVRNVDLIPSGKVAPNPADLLAGHAMKEFLEEAKGSYEMVLVDSPPALAFSDACIMAPLVSGVFLIARSGLTTDDAIIRGESALNAVGARMIGVILNGVSNADRFGSYRYDYDRYSNSGDGHAQWQERLKQIARSLLAHFRKNSG